MKKKTLSIWLWIALIFVFIVIFSSDYFLEISYKIKFEEIWIITSLIIGAVVLYFIYLHHKKIAKKSESLIEIFKEKSTADKVLMIALFALMIFCFTAVVLEQEVSFVLTVFESEEMIVLGISTMILFIVAIYRAIIHKW